MCQAWYAFVMKNDYLHRIENAKVYDVARKTELEKARDLSSTLPKHDSFKA